jgi:hypothetical protein
MKRSVVVAGLVAVLLAACSLSPQRPVTKEELYKTKIYNAYIIRQSPESVLDALNREGEVVLEAKIKDTPVYLKLLATPNGLEVSVIER